MKNALSKVLILAIVFVLILSSCGDNNTVSSQFENQTDSSQEAGTSNYDTVKTQKEQSNKYLLLVNSSFPLNNFNPSLSIIKNEYCYNSLELQFDSNAINQLESLIENAHNAGHTTLYVKEAYRTEQQQRDCYNQTIAEYQLQFPTKSSTQISDLVKTVCDKPNESEYQTGYCVDFVYAVTTATVQNNVTYQWLLENSADYGFVLRYPIDKEAETGKSFDFMHFRYVGVQDAQLMKTLNLCLEEYLFIEQ